MARSVKSVLKESECIISAFEHSRGMSLDWDSTIEIKSCLHLVDSPYLMLGMTYCAQLSPPYTVNTPFQNTSNLCTGFSLYSLNLRFIVSQAADVPRQITAHQYTLKYLHVSLEHSSIPQNRWGPSLDAF